MSTWRLGVFGGLSLSSPDGVLFHVTRPKLAELVAFLALRRTSVVDRDSIVEALWPDVDFHSGRNRLKQCLALLRKEVPDLPIVVHGRNGLELDRSQVEIDAEAIEGRMKWLRLLQPHERVDAARQMLDEISKGILPELRSDWVFAEQTRFASIEHRLRAECAVSQGDSRPAFRFGDELGGARVPIIGRERECAWIAEWLANSHHRFLTLVGPPGVGKTRLLKEVTAGEAGFCDATISLSTVQTSEAPWLERIGQIIGIHGHDQIIDGLARLLLGFNHPVIAVDDLDQAGLEMQSWLEHLCHLVPHLKVLSSARSRLPGTMAEYFEVGTLPALDGGASPARDLLVCFADHFGVAAKTVQQNMDALEELARHLEGLPLSLEVAAGWLPYVQPARLLEQLKASPTLLIARAAEGRDSLKECIRAICSSLPEQDRDALRCLSVCRGGCGEELAEQMLGEDWPWRLRSLNERSLLFRTEGQRGNRVVVLQAIRECVQAVEPQNQMEEALARHRRACFALAERAGWEVGEGDRAGWLDFLRDEGDNILLATVRCFEELPELDRAVRLLTGLRSGFWVIRRTGEFNKVFAEACLRIPCPSIDGATEVPPAVVQKKLLEMAAEGRAEEAIRLSSLRIESLIGKHSPPFDIADAYDVQGDLRRQCKDLTAAIDCFKKSQSFFLEAGYRRHALWLEAKLSGTERESGLISEASQRQITALSRASELNDHNSVGMYSKQFAKEAMVEGRWPDAQRLAAESIAAFSRAGESTTTFEAYLVLAASQLGVDDHERAAATLAMAAEYAPVSHNGRHPDLKMLKDAIWDERKFYLLSLDAAPRG